jgi:hypothetical protein
MIRSVAFATVLLLLAATAMAHMRQQVYTDEDERNHMLDLKGVGGPEGAEARRHQDVVDGYLRFLYLYLLYENINLVMIVYVGAAKTAACTRCLINLLLEKSVKLLETRRPTKSPTSIVYPKTYPVLYILINQKE